jgi:hypothetical protein
MPNRIPLTQGQVARVDASDHAWLSQWRWRYATNGYAIRTYTDPQGQPRYALMHRVIMQARPGKLVDHIDGNRLNNTRANLRIVDRHQNMWNRQANANISSHYKGVTAYRHGWRVRIRYYNRRIHLGYCQDQEAAALLYDAAARRLFGEEYARVNFPDRPTPPQIQDRLDQVLQRWEATHGALTTP